MNDATALVLYRATVAMTVATNLLWNSPSDNLHSLPSLQWRLGCGWIEGPWICADSYAAQIQRVFVHASH